MEPTGADPVLPRQKWLHQGALGLCSPACAGEGGEGRKVGGGRCHVSGAFMPACKATGAQLELLELFRGTWRESDSRCLDRGCSQPLPACSLSQP